MNVRQSLFDISRRFVAYERKLRSPKRVSLRRMLVEKMEDRRLLAVTVVNNNDLGPGSLRDAIEFANSNPGADTITFNIPTGMGTSIRPSSPLPAISDSVTIDGWSQPGFAGSPVIELDGSDISNSNGLFVVAPNVSIRGLAVNRFSGGSGFVVTSAAATNSWIYGNYIGCDLSGTIGLGNATGILLDKIDGATVGSNGDGVNDVLERNVIAGQLVYPVGGVSVFRSSNVAIRGNYIGTDFTGSVAISNGNSNIAAWESSSLQIIDNLISGGAYFGILMYPDVHDVTIQRNLIGTDASGTQSLGNTYGIWMQEGTHNVLIGGPSIGQGNLISGNSGLGIIAATYDVHDVTIQGNKIGTNLSGDLAVPNGFGISVAGSNIRIGGSLQNAGNVISGNTEAGIAVSSNNNSIGTWIEGNKIGTDVTGSYAIGNGDGVKLMGFNTFLGGVDPSKANIISGNVGAGVLVGGVGLGSTIRGNSIFGNGRLGIDIIGDNVSWNDIDDADEGPNHLQNFPVLVSAEAGLSTVIDGSLNSKPNSVYTLDFYAGVSADPSGYGEGQRYLGAVSVTTDNNGNATFSASLNTSTSDGEYITATATAADGSTSEFSHVTVAINQFEAPVVVSWFNGNWKACG